eukprot:Nitzschia sp. Nitz4//scaffold56_size114212//37997//40636//NITZ4_003940-RA/size114212-processed-gene-0.3-mRNA-1//1//CDS//3329554676//8436//frame0
MPLFGLSSPPASFGSPSSYSMPLGESSAEATVGPASVRLSCLSPDGRSVHSFRFRQSAACIETHALPLEGSIEETFRDDDTPALVTTTLPSNITSALRQFPALELLCVDVIGKENSKSSSLQTLPKLCLYSKKDVFLIEIGYDKLPGAAQVEGRVVSLVEPFEEIMIGRSMSIGIIRIRAAPQRHAGYAFVSPPKSIAMLMYDTATNEYNLHLYHGQDSTVTTPLVYSMEQLDNPLEQVTDFCMLQSGSFSLLSGLSVAVLKGSGDVLQASPILFKGTVVPIDQVDQTIQYLDAQLQKHDSTSPKGRQYRAAQQYVFDCFPKGQAKGHFILAQDRSAAFDWPAQLQGPLLVAPESDDFLSKALAIEPLAPSIATMDMASVAIGHCGYKVNLGLLAPTMLIPRFSFERAEDTQNLDESLGWGAIVQCVDLKDENDEEKETSIAIIRDPLMDTVVHYVTPRGIRSLSSNALQIACNEISPSEPPATGFMSPLKRKDRRPRTTGWSCLDVSPGGPEEGVGMTAVVGAVVSGDAQFGHVLICRLSDGTMYPVNLTETRQLQEMEALGEGKQLLLEAPKNVSKEEEMLKQTSPLVDVIEPSIEKLVAGLRGMGRIVGSATHPERITPDLLAAAVEVKEQCDKEVVMPLLAINEHVNARMEDIVHMYNNNLEQLKLLRESMSQLKKGESSIHDKVEVATSNADSLAKRSASVLQSANDLLPTITQAEYDYFQELSRLQEKMAQWKQQVDRLKLRSGSLLDSLESGTNKGVLSIPEESMQPLKTMLQASETTMKRQNARLEELEETLDEVAAVAGIDRDPSGPVGPKQ